MGSQMCKTVKVSENNRNSSVSVQNFRIRNQNVAIKCKASLSHNRVLDVCQDKDAFGSLIIYEDYGQENQRFDILEAGDYVYLRNRRSGKYLTVGSNSEKNFAPIFQEPVLGTAGQKFRLQKIGEKEYFIHTFCGKVLDCNKKETSNGTRVVQFDFTRDDIQKWIIE